MRLRAVAAAVAAAGLLAGAVAVARTPHAIRVGYRFQVFLVDRDGGARRLTGGLESHGAPVWSRRGLRIAIGARTGIEIRDLRGSVKHVIPRGGGYVSWAPHDRRLAYVRFHEYERPGLYSGDLTVSGLDGQRRRVVATRAAGPVDWSPDGRWLYYVRGLVDRGPEGIWAVRPDGRDSHRLVAEASFSGPSVVSPDGRYVLFARGGLDERRGLWAARTDGRGELPLRVGRLVSPYYYGWLRNGREVFVDKHHRRPLIVSLSGRRRLLGARVHGFQYDLSSDGNRVAWVSRRRGRTLIMSARAGDGPAHALARFTSQGGLTEVDTLDWSPDGRRLLVVPYRHEGD